MSNEALGDAIARVLGTPRLNSIIAICVASAGLPPTQVIGTYKANYDGIELEMVPPTAATSIYDTITYTAIILGITGNTIVLNFSGTQTVQQVVDAWNGANPANQVSFTGGAGTRISPAGSTSLVNGINGCLLMHSDPDPGVTPADIFTFTLGTGASEVTFELNSTTGKVTIHGPTIELIRGATEPAILGNAFKLLYNGHTHKPLAAVASYMGVVFTSVNTDGSGNTIALPFDNASTVQQIVDAWNLAHPTNLVTFVGTGTLVLATYTLTLGTPIIASPLIPAPVGTSGGWGFASQLLFDSMVTTINQLVDEVRVLKLAAGVPASQMGATQLSSKVTVS